MFAHFHLTLEANFAFKRVIHLILRVQFIFSHLYLAHLLTCHAEDQLDILVLLAVLDVAEHF